jgi:hypothetical protein
MSDLLIWIYSSGGGREVYETGYKSLGNSGLNARNIYFNKTALLLH